MSKYNDIVDLHNPLTKVKLLKLGLQFDWFHRQQMEPIAVIRFRPELRIYSMFSHATVLLPI